jgi:hypothetical protein
MNTIASTLLHLIPGAEFSVRGTPTTAKEYADAVTWIDARPQPSWSDIQAALPDAEKQAANDKAKQARADAYRNEADPLYFGWQRGENTEQAWLDKVAEIRARFPYQA